MKIGIFSGASGGVAILLGRWPMADLVDFESFKQGLQRLMSERIGLLAIGEMQRDMVKPHVARPVVVHDSFHLPLIFMHVRKRHDELAVRLGASIKLLKRRYPEPVCNIDDYGDALWP